MAIQKLIVCLSSLIILTSRSTSSLPQGLLNNFGLPVQNQEFGQRPLFPGFQPLPSIPPPTFIPIKQTGPQSRLLTKKNPAIPEPHIAISDNSTLIHEESNRSAPIALVPNVKNSNLTRLAKAKKSESLISIAWNAFVRFDPKNLVPTGVALVGAAFGMDECYERAACLAGSLVPPVWKRDMFVAAAETLVPETWRSTFAAAKHAIINEKKDCSQFKCF